jgi:hypothetical protein
MHKNTRNPVIAFRVNAGKFSFTEDEALEIADIVENIRKWVDAATPAQWDEGYHWYDDARRLCEAVSRDMTAKGLTKPDGTPVSVGDVAVVLAVTSNNAPWERQVAATGPLVEAVCRGYSFQTICEMRLGLIHKYVLKAVKFLHGDTSVLNGPKVEIFRENIEGDHRRPTIDRHAARVGRDTYLDENACGRWTVDGIRRYMLEAAYLIMADYYELPAAIVQAIAWTVYRNSPEYKAGLEASKAAKRAAKKAAA